MCLLTTGHFRVFLSFFVPLCRADPVFFPLKLNLDESFSSLRTQTWTGTGSGLQVLGLYYWYSCVSWPQRWKFLLIVSIFPINVTFDLIVRTIYLKKQNIFLMKYFHVMGHNAEHSSLHSSHWWSFRVAADWAAVHWFSCISAVACFSMVFSYDMQFSFWQTQSKWHMPGVKMTHLQLLFLHCLHLPL